MSYQVLARKWRPKRFQELMGQEHVVAVLTNALAQQRLHHAYLFTGTRGVGKTTIARIFAKSLNCDTGISAEPCGGCDTCKDIDQGNFVDLLEIDAASRTKVDDTREILDNVQYAPTRGRYKVYLIDEVHMLSRSSFNALLKTLEEPPEHVKFILATTDPQKLPITVLSRCLQFHLKALTPSQIQQQLQIILAAEQVTADNGALALLAKAARGSMRDALSLTDQAIAQGNGHIVHANVQQMLGGIDNNWVYQIVIALLKNEPQELMQLSLNIASYSPSYSRLLAELIQLFHQIALAQVVGNSFDLPRDQASLLDKFCQALSPEDVQLYYQIALTGRKDLPYACDEQAAFDMVLLRLLAFQPVKNSAELVSDIEHKQAVNTIEFSCAEFNNSESTDTANITPAQLKTEEPSGQGPAEPAETAQPEANPFVSKPLVSEPIASEPLAEQTSANEVTQNEVNTELLNTDTLNTLFAEQEQIEKMAQAQGQVQGQIISPPVQHPQPPVIESQVETGQIASSESASSQNTCPDGDSQQKTAADHQANVDVFASDAQADATFAGADYAEQAYSEMAEQGMAYQQEYSQQYNQEYNQKTSDAFVEPASEPQAPPANENSTATELTPNSADFSQPATTKVDTVTESILATRNMLRSRKKSLESGAKKLSNAAKRPNSTDALTHQALEQTSQPQQVAPQPIKNELPPLPELPFNAEEINPEVVKKANQVDKWANMIDSMGLMGRIRQLAIHATISPQSTDDVLVLELDQATKHLNSDNARQQLEAKLCEFMARKVTITVNVVEQTIDDPFQIQGQINDKRYQYAKDLLANDDIVQSLQQAFQAQLNEETIVAR